MSFILDIGNLFSTFQEDTFPTYKNPIEREEEGSEENYSLLNTDLKRLQRLAQQKLNYSLLAGEYVENCNLSEQLEEIKANLSLFLNEFIFLPNSQSESYDLIYGLQFACDFYLAFLKDVQNRYSLHQEDYLFSVTTVLRTTLGDKELSSESKNFFKFFYYNVAAAKCDHFLSHDNDQLINLFSIEKGIIDLKLNGFEELTQLLIDKISFLKIKWIYRRQKESPKEFSFLIDSKEGQTDDLRLNSIFTPWNNYIKQHYELEHNWEAKSDKSFREHHTKNLDDLSFLQIHQRIKYFKDVKKSSVELKRLAEKLKSSYKKDSTDEKNCQFFDDFAHLISVNYAYNNYFSLFVEESDDVFEIQKEYKELVDKKHHYINNFFIEQKFLDSILNILTKKLEVEDSMEFLMEYEGFIENYCAGVFKKYKSNYRWSISHHNYVFQLPFKECRIKLESENIPYIFISSSFVLPPPNEGISDDYDSLNSRFHTLSSQLQSIKNLKQDISKIQSIKEELADQKKEIKNREIKSIEILGIFTALIAFIFGSISTYEFIETPFQALMFIGALGVSLISFVLALLFLNRGLTFLKKSWWFLFGILIIFFLYWSSLNHFFSLEQRETESQVSQPESTADIDLSEQQLIPSNKPENFTVRDTAISFQDSTAVEKKE